mgnify:CR=1 FL=1
MITRLLELIPESLRIPIVCVILGGGGVAYAEARYMTVSDFTKSYVLDLKAEIRALERELRRDGLDPEYVAMLREQLASMIAELCYETDNNDPYCKGRT